MYSNGPDPRITYVHSPERRSKHKPLWICEPFLTVRIVVSSRLDREVSRFFNDEFVRNSLQDRAIARRLASLDNVIRSLAQFIAPERPAHQRDAGGKNDAHDCDHDHDLQQRKTTHGFFRNWKNFLDIDSGLPSNFLNQVKAVDGNRCWFSTDKGLAYYDGENWAVYRPSLDAGKPEMLVRDAAGNVTSVAVETAPAHNYIFGIDFQGDDVWVATARGVSHGVRQR